MELDSLQEGVGLVLGLHIGGAEDDGLLAAGAGPQEQALTHCLDVHHPN